MKTKILFLIGILIFFVGSSLFAQTPDWQWAKGHGSGYSVGDYVVTDANGNVFVAGNINGKYLIKYDSLGNVVWEKNLGAEAYRVALDSLGNIFVTGEFYTTTVTFGSFTLTNSGPPQADMFIVKLDASGNELWAKSSVASVGSEIPSSVITDRNNNVLVTGYFNTATVTFGGVTLTNLGFAHAYNSDFCVKYDPSGNVLWARNGNSGLGGAGGTNLAVDKNDNILMSGDIYGSLYVFGSDSLILADTLHSNIFVVKYNSAGNELWAKGFGGKRSDQVIGGAIDKNGNLFLTGSFQSDTLIIGSYTLINSGVIGTDDVLLVKLDSSGNVLFAKNPTGTDREYSCGVATDTAGSAYITGYYYGAYIDFGADVLNNSAPTSTDIFIVKYDATGNEVWVKGVGGPYLDYADAITVNKKDDVFITGNTGSVSLTFGSATIVNPSAPAGDYYIAKLGSTVDSVWPGDANGNRQVDNNDLLPIGLYYSDGGFARPFTGNVWQADACNNWAILEANGKDIKNADCNGDGIINNNDTLAINLNFSSTHAFAPIHTENRMAAPDLHFVTSSGTYTSGSMVDVEVWAGNSTTPVTNLYGLAFTINYDASLVQPTSESLTYPVSWLGTPGTDAIKIGKIDALATKAYGAETRIDHANASGFGKIADFKFQLKSSIPSNTVMHFSTAGYSANDATGIAMTFNTPTDSIIINPSALGINENSNAAQISVYPNPTNGIFNIYTSEPIKNGSIEVYNSLGVIVYNQKIVNQQNIIELKNQTNGLYFVKVMSENKIIGEQKIVKQ